MRRAPWILFVVAAIGCGPSRKTLDAERAAYTQYLDSVLELDRVVHGCDAERKAWMDQLDLWRQALKGYNRSVQAQVERDKDLADLKMKTCESKLPPMAQVSGALVEKRDAWLDACLECASGKTCVALERQSRRGGFDSEHLRPRIAEMRAHSGCSAGLRALAAR